MQLNFGSGNAIAKRTDVLYNRPVVLGVLQDIEIDFSQSIKELIGQYKMPVDIAPAELKITGKAKYARIQADGFNALLLGMTETVNAGSTISVAEAHTPAAGTATMANTATFVEDLGVYYVSTGLQLQPAASASGAGIYVAPAAGSGVYTHNAADNTIPLLYTYSYTVSTLLNVAGTSALMGTGPQFQLILEQNYTVQGTTKTLFMKFNACRATKMNMPMKNTDYTINDFEFQAFADGSNNWGSIVTSE